MKLNSNILREFRSFFNLGAEINPVSLLENYSGVISSLKSIFKFISKNVGGTLFQNHPTSGNTNAKTLEKNKYSQAMNRQLIYLAKSKDDHAKVPSVEYSKLKIINQQMKKEFEKMKLLKIDNIKLERKIEAMKIEMENEKKETQAKAQKNFDHSERVKLLVQNLQKKIDDQEAELT